MKVNSIALMLLLAMLLGIFGCAAPQSASVRDAIAEIPSFIGESSDPLGAGGETSERPAQLLNFAMLSSTGAAEFQIVYKTGSGVLVQDECVNLANEIKKVTGVAVPVVSSNEKQKTYEILVGDIARAETVDVKNQYRLDENKFVVRVVDTRVMVYAKNEQAVITGMVFLMNMLAYKNSEAKEYGISADLDYLYQPVEHPPVKILSVDEHYVEFGLENAANMYAYARLSFTGNGAWRLQSKPSADATYNDFGAAQRLAYSLGEKDPSVLEEITTATVGAIFTATASDGSCVKINTAKFQMDFYTSSGKLASTVTNITTYSGGSSITGVLEENEAIFGTGERFDNTNQRGKYIEMFSKDIWSQSNACYMVIPLLCSSRGSGVFVNLTSI